MSQVVQASTEAAPLISSSTLWYLSRATGLVTLVVFTATFALGLLTAGRVNSPKWPRFVTEGLHRNLSLIAIGLVGVHALLPVIDDFVPISVVDAFVPFVSAYLPIWVGFGAIALDVMLALVITGLLRHRMTFRGWKWIHWLAYLGWPVALAHTIGIGTDRLWVLAVVSTCVLSVLVAGGYRLAGWRRVALGRPQ
jgi:methionine sulfoxide reductase heme-binding subunit